jgi:hypothetical protein
MARYAPTRTRGTNEQKRLATCPNVQLLHTAIRVWSGFSACQWLSCSLFRAFTTLVTASKAYEPLNRGEIREYTLYNVFRSCFHCLFYQFVNRPNVNHPLHLFKPAVSPQTLCPSVKQQATNLVLPKESSSLTCFWVFLVVLSIVVKRVHVSLVPFGCHVRMNEECRTPLEALFDAFRTSVHALVALGRRCLCP